MTSSTEHISVLRDLRGRLPGNERAALRHVLNRLEQLETKLKTINRLSHLKRDAQGYDRDED